MENLDLENDKREEFRQILYELARAAFDEAKEDYLPIIERLESLYWNDEKGDNTGFRHFYSDIFSVLVDIQNEEVTNKAGSIAVLGNNLGLIRQHYQKNKNHDKNQRPIDISNNLKKLFDHVSLDIARMEYSTIIFPLEIGKITARNACTFPYTKHAITAPTTKNMISDLWIC